MVIGQPNPSLDEAYLMKKLYFLYALEFALIPTHYFVHSRLEPNYIERIY